MKGPVSTQKRFPATAYELLLKLYGQYFDFLFMKTELPIIFSSKEFLESNILDLKSQYSINISHKIICFVINHTASM
jgi:hypothetical protein